MKKLSKYKEIAEVMRINIITSQWSVYDSIPSERELAEFFEVNRITVRKAITHLRQRGYLRSEAKKGNVVLPARCHDAQMFYSFSDDIKKSGGMPGQKILEFGHSPISDLLRDNLSIPLSVSTILKVKRIRYSDTTPIGIQTTYIRLDANQEINSDDLEKEGSLYSLLEKKFGIKMIEAYESVGARLPSLQEKQFLELGHDDVVLTGTRITYSQNMIPIEYVEMVYAASRYSYKMKVNSETYEY